MDAAFWHERWTSNRIGFHQDEVNPYLKAYWPRLGLQGGRVLVPLCGKSRDMLYLRDRGHAVLGVELSPIAVEAFFKENGLGAEQEQRGAFAAWQCDGIEVLCGDFFALDRPDARGIEGVYDRASLIALPPGMRARYAGLLAGLMDRDARALLVTIDYPQDEKEGPPFSVPEGEVLELFGDDFGVQRLESRDVLDENRRLREQGITSLKEEVYLLERLASGKRLARLGGTEKDLRPVPRRRLGKSQAYR